MSEMKTLKFPGDAEPREIVDAKAREDISRLFEDMLTEAELSNAVDNALAQAKESGEFDGADGKTAYQYAVEGGYTGTEEEFAAKLAEEMPEKLPNPNALTFTGAVTGSYDGSEALTVEIPSGGGLPTGGAAYQQLVTDGDGNAKWEDRPFYIEKGAVIRSVSGLSWSENTGYKKDEYQYKSDVDTNVFKTLDEIPNIDGESIIQVVVDGVTYSNMTIDYTNGGGAYSIDVYSEECPVFISSVNAYMADTVTVTFLSNRTNINSVQVIDLGKDSIKAMSSDYIEFASTTYGSTKKFKITVDDSGAITATEV